MKKLLLALIIALTALPSTSFAQKKGEYIGPIIMPTERRPDANGPTSPAPIDYSKIIKNETFLQLPPEIQEEIVQEAEMIANDCKVSPINRRYTDCDCLGTSFIDARVNDPVTHHTMLRLEIAKSCPNGPAVAAYEYNRCITLADLPKRVSPQEYCKCYGNEYGRLYEANTMPTFSAQRGYSMEAYDKCDRDFQIGIIDGDY